MHSCRLSDHPRITLHTDGGQTDGQFYISGPRNYAEKAAQTPLDDQARHTAWSEGTLEGEAEIIFLMERLEALALEPGEDTDVVTLRGPRSTDNQGRFDEDVTQWFETNGQGNESLIVDEIQLLREDVRSLWKWTMIEDIRERVERLGNHKDATTSFRTLSEVRKLLMEKAP